MILGPDGRPARPSRALGYADMMQAYGAYQARRLAEMLAEWNVDALRQSCEAEPDPPTVRVKLPWVSNDRSETP